MPERRFEPREVKRILRRAAEVQSSTTGDAEPQPTLRQLQDAAAELGISPEAVARAAAEVAEEPAGFWSKLWGGPFSIVRTEVVDGLLPAEARPAFLQRIRDHTGLIGEVRSIEGGFEFFHECKETNDMFLVSVIPEGNRSRITIRSDYKVSLLYYLSLMVPTVPLLMLLGGRHSHPYLQWNVGLATLALGMGLATVALGICTIATFLTARGQVMRSVGRGRKSVESLIGALATEIERRQTVQPAFAHSIRISEIDPPRISA